MTRRRAGPVQARPWRVVLDTNIVVSALVFAYGPAARIRRAWQEGLILPLGSRPTVAELMRVLAYPKFRLSAADQAELLADYLPALAVVTVPQPLPAVPHCRDPHDLPFLHLAAAGQADALVTGDADLLALADAVPWRVLSLAELLEHLPAISDS
ncbi:MAG: putative toxin-antitoxin system toxin component, PIN family [bacterium]|nr:putative toxin-antitoxin system toxin component, PIN family [Betaproteobacteria bacterium]